MLTRTVTLAQAVNQARPYVVQVRVGNVARPSGIGTGFFVDRSGLIATAYHVVEDQSEIHAGFTHVPADSIRGNFMMWEADVVAVDERNDIALIRHREANPFEWILGKEYAPGLPYLLDVARLYTARPEDGEPIGVSGYPLGNPILVSAGGFIASAWANDMLNWEWSELYLGDVQVNPGNSGGPAYRVSDASVVGVVIATQMDIVKDREGKPPEVEGQPLEAFANANIALIRPTSYVAELMKSV